MKRTPLQRKTGLKRTGGLKRTPLKRTSAPVRSGSTLKRSTAPKKRRAISPASPAQRAKVKDAVSIVSGQEPCDPMHLVSRSIGGCDHELCVLPATRAEHRAYDEGELDLSPYLMNHIPEVAHALTHVNGSLLRLMRIVTGKRWVPEEAA